METSVKNLMFDLTSGREIYDEKQGRVISNEEANEVLRKSCFEILGLTEKSTEKQIKRALESDRAIEFFEVMEEILDRQIEYGWRDNEFFQNYVETRNQKDGDRTEFNLLVEEDTYDFFIENINSVEDLYTYSTGANVTFIPSVFNC